VGKGVAVACTSTNVEVLNLKRVLTYLPKDCSEELDPFSEPPRLVLDRTWPYIIRTKHNMNERALVNAR
jgi:hypothetical protein